MSAGVRIPQKIGGIDVNEVSLQSIKKAEIQLSQSGSIEKGERTFIVKLQDGNRVTKLSIGDFCSLVEKKMDFLRDRGKLKENALMFGKLKERLESYANISGNESLKNSISNLKRCIDGEFPPNVLAHFAKPAAPAVPKTEVSDTEVAVEAPKVPGPQAAALPPKAHFQPKS